MTTDPKTILFPHSYLPGSLRERVLSSVTGLVICKPWHMDDKDAEEERDGRMHVLRPPEDLRPPADFKRLLDEYRAWVTQNPGYVFFPMPDQEGATWDIRRSLRGNDLPAQRTLQETALHWHLILHLEKELEENRATADELLLRVKAQSSPLQEALGETGPQHGLLDDLPVSNPYADMDDRRIKQVLRAWFGLFGAFVPEDGTLLTLSPGVLTYAADLFDLGPLGESMTKKAPWPDAIHLPGLFVDARAAQRDPVRAGLSGKTVVLAAGG